jgi:glycosyltransferase involved in cell wall biosynthesis
MHVLFLHQNFPAQFGQIAMHLARSCGYRCTCVSEKELADSAEIQHVCFQSRGGAQQHTHYCSRTFENQTWRSDAVYEALRVRPDIQPDLIVAHSGFVSSLFLRELYPGVPHVGYFEFFYHAHGSDMDFRKDLPLPPAKDFLRVRSRNAQLLLDLHNCDAGYSPTEFQRAQLPAEYQPKIRTIFDGIDIDFWQRADDPPRSYGGVAIPDGHRLVTYVSRGFEAMRGFDIFLRVADRICRQRQNVTVIVVGEDRVAYGGDSRFTGGKSFKQWSVEQHRPDLSRIHFIGRLPPRQLAQLWSLSDLHLYLTVPFVLSWSLMNALSCGCKILASDTAPVREMIHQGETGLLVDFFDVDRFVEQAIEVLDHPAHYTSLGQAGRRLIETRYSIPICLAQMQELYQSVLGGLKSSRL